MEGSGMKEEIVKDMTPKLIGETYLKKATETSPQRYRYGLFECQYCGEEFEARVDKVKSGHTKSCGCLVGKNMTHGLTYNRFYKTWNGMVQRCTNPKTKNYKNYGGRGITVCEEWLDIRNFVDWAKRTYPNTKGVSLDRIDNGKGYSPENCRWADASTQNTNQRMSKKNTSGFVGVNYHNTGIAKWTACIGVNHELVYIGSYLTIEEAVLARDNYIIENNLPHKLSTDYKKETK